MSLFLGGEPIRPEGISNPSPSGTGAPAKLGRTGPAGSAATGTATGTAKLGRIGPAGGAATGAKSCPPSKALGGPAIFRWAAINIPGSSVLGNQLEESTLTLLLPQTQKLIVKHIIAQIVTDNGKRTWWQLS
jgi:hypothetical protein